MCSEPNQQRRPAYAMATIRRSAKRRGVTAVETAMVFSTVFLVLFAVFGMGLTTFQYNTLSAVARQVARVAIVHGSTATPQESAWGPASYSGTADDGSEIAAAAAPLLATIPPGSVSINVTWLDGGNAVNNRVQVVVSYTRSSWIPFLPVTGPVTLQASSTMPILH
jgi:Flp pilus assembly protein TadG